MAEIRKYSELSDNKTDVLKTHKEKFSLKHMLGNRTEIKKFVSQESGK